MVFTEIITKPLELLFDWVIKRFSLLNTKYQEHDKNIFYKSEENMSEIDFLGLLDNLSSGNNYLRLQGWKLFEYIKYFEYPGNQYLTNNVKNKNILFLNNLKLLSTFLCTHFFLHPENQTSDNAWFSLFPEFKYSEGEKLKLYDNYSNQLQNLINEIKPIYDKYRFSIKRKLFI